MKDIFIGLMSGTSVDKVDAVAVYFDEKGVNLIGSHLEEIPNEIKKEILELVSAENIKSLDFSKTDIKVAELFVLAINNLLKKTSLSHDQIKAIGSHGQTIKHSPFGKEPFSLQIGNPELIKELTQIKTISNFRKADIDAGGQGAPLAPLFHKEIFSHKESKTAVINIGGISNVTFLNIEDRKVFGYDIGPGNCLMDSWIRKTKKLDFDNKGLWAQQGGSIPELVQLMLKEKFFNQHYPKSTGPDYFNLEWLNEKIVSLGSVPKNEDVQASLLELTAEIIYRELKKYLNSITKIFVCGGGIHNSFLISTIEKKIGKQILSSLELGVDPDLMEAICFAWLAKERLTNNYFNLSEITGSKGHILLGEIS